METKPTEFRRKQRFNKLNILLHPKQSTREASDEEKGKGLRIYPPFSWVGRVMMILAQIIPPGESVKGNNGLFVELQTGLEDAGSAKAWLSTIAEELERISEGGRKTDL